MLNLDHAEEVTTFACKKKEFIGPQNHHHSNDAEALRFFISADISSIASSPANPELIQVQYTHNLNAFVITVPIDYMQCITFGAVKHFSTDSDAGPPVHYVFIYDTHTVTAKFLRTDRWGKSRLVNVKPDLDTFRKAISAALSQGSYEIERVWNYPSPSGLISMEFGFAFHDVHSKPDLQIGFQAGLNKPLHIINGEFKIKGIPQTFTIEPVYCVP